ncbi:MAG: hypothetical protein ACYTXA_21845 [Nostoc sp.]
MASENSLFDQHSIDIAISVESVMLQLSKSRFSANIAHPTENPKPFN